MSFKWKSSYYQTKTERASVHALQPRLDVHLWINICVRGKKHIEKRQGYFLDV